ncbi:MAG: hypothetical protein LAO07_14530 [Acidobacteriia bacterium]|nr:hypothetical protein [Terriglobia bacterium]
MAFDVNDREPGDDLEDYGDELSSDYKEEEAEQAAEEGEELEEEVSYETEESAKVETPAEPRARAAPPSGLLHRQLRASLRLPSRCCRFLHHLPHRPDAAEA